MPKLFAYGTLQLPEVMAAVAGRAFPARPARLDGHSRHRLRGKSFPGIRPNPGSAVAGTVFSAIDAAALGKLDAFEDSFYRRETVTVALEDGARWRAFAYIVREESYGLLLPEEWSLDEFRRAHLENFLDRHE